MRLAFCKALGMEPGEAATTEIIMAISADETQKMLQSAEVETVNDNGATEARGIKGIEVARLMAPVRRLAKGIDDLGAAAKLPPPTTQAPQPTAGTAPAPEDHTAKKFTDVVAQGLAGSFRMMSSDELEEARLSHLNICGREPPLECRPPTPSCPG